MKEKIQKLAADLATAVTLLKEEKTEEAVAALETVSEGVATIEADATALEESVAAKDAEIVEKSAEIQKGAEEIKKYANLSVSAENMAELLSDVASVKTMLTESAGIMKTVSTKEDIGTITTRLETIEKAADSRQIRDENRGKMEKSAISGLDLTPRA